MDAQDPGDLRDAGDGFDAATDLCVDGHGDRGTGGDGDSGTGEPPRSATPLCEEQGRVPAPTHTQSKGDVFPSQPPGRYGLGPIPGTPSGPVTMMPLCEAI
jgi:hypothetical protein